FASSVRHSRQGAGGLHGNYGSALAAHPGEPQGRPDKASGSQPIVQRRPTRTHVLPAPHVPDGLTIPLLKAADTGTPRPSCLIKPKSRSASKSSGDGYWRVCATAVSSR